MNTFIEKSHAVEKIGRGDSRKLKSKMEHQTVGMHYDRSRRCIRRCIGTAESVAGDKTLNLPWNAC